MKELHEDVHFENITCHYKSENADAILNNFINAEAPYKQLNSNKIGLDNVE